MTYGRGKNMKYRKKPVVIEAWLADKNTRMPEWLVRAESEGLIYFHDKNVMISTLEGIMQAKYGQDYIIKGIEGEIYPCKKDIFEKTYEPFHEETEMQ